MNERLAPFRVLRGTECDIRSDGTLDLPDDVLAELDWVQLSLHAGQRQDGGPADAQGRRGDAPSGGALPQPPEGPNHQSPPAERPAARARHRGRRSRKASRSRRTGCPTGSTSATRRSAWRSRPAFRSCAPPTRTPSAGSATCSSPSRPRGAAGRRPPTCSTRAASTRCSGYAPRREGARDEALARRRRGTSSATSRSARVDGRRDDVEVLIVAGDAVDDAVLDLSAVAPARRELRRRLRQRRRRGLPRARRRGDEHAGRARRRDRRPRDRAAARGTASRRRGRRARAGGPLGHAWSESPFLGRDLSGSTLGIVGLGRIGAAVAKRALAFDMRVLYHRRSDTDRRRLPGARRSASREPTSSRCTRR